MRHTRHTPGPWEARPQDQGQAFEPICTVWEGTPGEGHVVAYVPLRHAKKEMPYEANARLVAAAPALVEALKMASRQAHNQTCESLGYMPPQAEDYCNCYKKLIKTALQQARGEA